MAKKRRSVKPARDVEETEESSDGELEAPPSLKRRKAKEPKAKTKLGKGKKGATDKSDEASASESTKNDLADSFDPSVPYTQPLDLVNSIVTCYLCKGYLVDATTIVECLHAFCKSCILRYFDDVDNCCPQCGELVHQSHPTQYISYDRTLQDLVYKLVPGLFESERLQREKYQKEQRRLAGDDVDEDEKKLEEEKRKREEEEERINRCYEGKPPISHHRNDLPMIVELVRGVTDLPEPEKKYVRASDMCTITSLKRYLSLAMYGTKSRYMEMDLFCNNELMGRDFSLKFIHLTRCRKKPQDEPLRLVYKHRVF